MVLVVRGIEVEEMKLCCAVLDSRCEEGANVTWIAATFQTSISRNDAISQTST